ncbi:MAG: NAD+ synthase [Candidatus Lokiarchaeota archaeon]|nr:NAD+ synthase [Candidatus Lokiarchaeota archaeon]
MREIDIKNTSKEIQKWIKKYLKSANADGVIIGISGGIDSALTAFLCSEALEKDSIICINIPCESNPEDYEDAKIITNAIGKELYTLDLTTVYREFLNQVKLLVKDNQIASANIKSRLRMTGLYYFAQCKGIYLVAGTGNRTELAIGYYTKYGDGGVDFESIGGLYKCEVKSLAKLLGVPEKIINKPPTAGLWQGQTDEKEIGISYNELDEIVYRIDHYLDLHDLNAKNVEKIIKMMKSAEHKSKMPPICKII